MRRGESGWRTASSWSPAAPAAVGAGEPVPHSGPAAPALSGARLWAYLIGVRSRLTSVSWSFAFIGILAYLFASTTYRLPIGTAAMIIGIAGLFLLPGGLRFPSSAGFFLAFLLWSAVGALASSWSGIAFDAILELGKVFLIYFVFVNAVRTRSQIWFLMVFFLAMYGTHPVRGTVINYLTGNTYFGRAAWYQGIFGNANDLAALTVLQLSMAAALLMTERKGIVKLGALFAMLALPFTILVTQSRAALIGLAVFTLAAIWGHPRKFKILGVVGLLIALAVMVAPNGVWQRLEGLRYATSTSTLSSVDEEGSASQRWAIWQTGWRVVKANPVAGTGLGTYRLANGSVSAALGDRDAHSTYLTLAAENGFIGLFLFMLLVGATLVRAQSVRRRVRRLIPAGALQLRFLEWGLIAFMIAGIWGSYSKLAFFYVHLALIWALAAACESEAAEVRRVATGTLAARR